VSRARSKLRVNPGRRDRRPGPLVPAHGLSYRDVEELLAERGIQVDHVTV
jgi:hypothetical protein